MPDPERSRSRFLDGGEEPTDSGYGLRRVNQGGTWTCADIERECTYLPWPVSGHRCKQWSATEQCLRCKQFRCVDCGTTWVTYGARTVETVDTRGRT